MAPKIMSERGYRVLSLPWAIKHESGLWRIEGEFGFFEIAPWGGRYTAFVMQLNSVEEFQRVDDERAIDRVLEYRERIAAERRKLAQNEYMSAMEKAIAKGWPNSVGFDVAKNNSSSYMSYSYVKRTRTK